MNSIEKDPCEICTVEQAESRTVDFDGIHQVCPRCGEFKLSGTAGSMLRRGVGLASRAKLSGWIRAQNRAGAVPMISSDALQSLMQRPLPPVAERALALLVEAERGLSGLGERFNINEPRFLAATYSADSSELNYLLGILTDQGLAEAKALGGICEILPGGYMKLDELRNPGTDSTQGFVAMWFDASLRDAYMQGFQPGILGAGYDPVRVDRVLPRYHGRLS